MDDIGDAGAVLLWIQVVVTYDHGAWVAPVQFLKQSSHGSLLSRRAGVSGLTSCIVPALIAHADRVGIMVLAVGTDHPFGTAWLYLSVTTDHVVVADTELPAPTAMPRVYLSGRTGLVWPHRRTVDYQHGYRSHLFL